MEFLVFKDTKVHSVATAEAELIRSICFGNLVNVTREKLRLMDLDELLHFSDANDINVALIFTATDCDIIDLAHCENVALCHDTVKNFKSQSIYKIKHFLFSSYKEHVMDDERVSHVLNVKSFDLSCISTFENINFVFTIHHQYMVLAYCIHMARSLTKI